MIEIFLGLGEEDIPSKPGVRERVCGKQVWYVLMQE